VDGWEEYSQVGGGAGSAGEYCGGVSLGQVVGVFRDVGCLL